MDGQTNENANIFAILSFVLGIVGIGCGFCCFCCFGGWLGLVISISSIVLGIISINRGESERGLAIVGIVTGSVALIIAVAIIALGLMFSITDEGNIEQYVERIQETL